MDAFTVYAALVYRAAIPITAILIEIVVAFYTYPALAVLALIFLAATDFATLISIIAGVGWVAAFPSWTIVHRYAVIAIPVLTRRTFYAGGRYSAKGSDDNQTYSNYDHFFA